MASFPDSQPKTGLARSLAALFDRAEQDVPSADGSSSESRIEDPLDPPVARDPAAAALELDLEIDDFVSGDATERVRAGARIRALAAVLTEAHRVEPMVDAVVRLAMTPSGDAVRDEAHRLACDLVSPDVANRLADRLGAVRDGSRRAVLSRVLGSLGPPMARAAGEALARTESRSARRGLTEVLVALGRDAEAVLVDMVEDERWYVVRNAVLILGEIGGDWSTPHLAKGLEHTDRRVRREALLALARSGRDDTGVRMVALIDDPAEEVREAAAVAIGALKRREAVEPLLQRLRAGDTEAVVVAVMRALGRIGDPRATDELKRRATGGIISRANPDVRAAAYRALAGIGTPKAWAVVRSGLKDRDPEVRTAAAEAIRGWT